MAHSEKEPSTFENPKTAGMKFKTLFFLCIVIGAAYAAFHFFKSKKSQPFDAELIRIDTTRVTSLLISLPNDQAEITLQRENGVWIASNGQINIRATSETTSSMLRALTNFKIREVIAQSSADWAAYALTEARATRIRVYANNQLLEDFMIGKSEIHPETEARISYLRLTDEDEVYAVEGILSNHFGYDFSDFRNKTILQMEPNLTMVSFEVTLPDTTFTYVRTPEGWQVNEMKLDSGRVESYLNSLRQISGEVFADDFDEVQGGSLLFSTLTLQPENGGEPFVIQCYRDSTRSMPFIIHSSQNPDAYFASDSLGIFARIIASLHQLTNGH